MFMKYYIPNIMKKKINRGKTKSQTKEVISKDNNRSTWTGQLWKNNVPQRGISSSGAWSGAKVTF